MGLTNLAVKHAKPKDTDFKLADEKGMYVLVTKSGGKYFRLDYRFAGKRKTLALGVYDETSLEKAREKRDEARKLLNDGIAPMKGCSCKKDCNDQAGKQSNNKASAVSASGLPMTFRLKITTPKEY